MTSSIFSLIVYSVFAISGIGFVWRIWTFYRAPAPLKIPTTPAPVTRSGVVWRMITEVAFFNSLFKGNKWTWLGGYLFHAALIFVVMRHFRYFVDPLPSLFSYLNIAGIVAGLIMIVALGYLWVRRLAVSRVRYISSIADYGVLGLLMAIGLTGALMTFVVRPDIVSIKTAMMDLMLFRPVELPADPLFLIHFGLVLVLILYFPFSKLMHLGGIFFSPTRYQVDNPREERHINPWSKQQ